MKLSENQVCEILNMSFQTACSKTGNRIFFDDGSLIEQSGSKNTVSPIAGRYSISDSTQSGDVVTTVKFDDKVKEWVYGGVERLLQRNH